MHDDGHELQAVVHEDVVVDGKEVDVVHAQLVVDVDMVVDLDVLKSW